MWFDPPPATVAPQVAVFESVKSCSAPSHGVAYALAKVVGGRNLFVITLVMLPAAVVSMSTKVL